VSVGGVLAEIRTEYLEYKSKILPLYQFTRLQRSCPCAEIIKHYVMKSYEGVDV
jgi:hypothetical protein